MLIRSNMADLFNTTALPAIHHIIFDSMKQKPDLIPTLFNYTKSDRDIEQTTTVSGFDVATTMGEGESVTYQDIIQGYDAVFTHLKYGKGFKVSKELLEDGKFLTIQKKSSALGKSLYEVRQVEAANVFNNGFSAQTGAPNSEALFSTTHALIRGGTEANSQTAADLSLTSLRQAISDVRDTRDDGNLRINLKPKYLLTSALGTQAMWDAYELTKSPDRPDTSNRAVNAFSPLGLTAVAWDYLTDPDAWFLVCDEHELYFFDRQPPELTTDKDFDTDAMKVKMTTRFSVGWADWRGVYGVAGA